MAIEMSASMSLSSVWQATSIRTGGSAAPERGTRVGADTAPGAPRPLVGRACGHRRRADAFRHLLVPRGDRERELFLRAVPLAPLLALPRRELRAPDAPARRAVLESVARDPHRRYSGRVPCHLLLLPPQLLPRVLLVAACLHDP